MRRLIIFDCDGTLVESEIIAAKVFPAVWKTMGVEMTEDYFICNFVGTGSSAEIVQRTIAQLPSNAMEISDQKFDEELALSLKPVQGMRELLEQIKHHVCVASNSSHPYILNALRKTQLDKFFEDRIYSARDLKNPKPAPDVFLHAAKTLNFNPDECIVIEDSTSGIMAAKNAGMRVVGLMAGLHFNNVVKEKLFAAKADYYCHSVSELKKLLADLSKI
jgi:HAD superfamily hydrolase (TIGR01509 family)